MFCRVRYTKIVTRKGFDYLGRNCPRSVYQSLRTPGSNFNQHFREIPLVFIFLDAMLAIQVFNEYTEFPKWMPSQIRTPASEITTIYGRTKDLSTVYKQLWNPILNLSHALFWCINMLFLCLYLHLYLIFDLAARLSLISSYCNGFTCSAATSALQCIK